MSRIGFKPVVLPAGVTFNIVGGVATVKGTKGELSVSIPADVSVEVKDGALHCKRLGEEQHNLENHGHLGQKRRFSRPASSRPRHSPDRR